MTWFLFHVIRHLILLFVGKNYLVKIMLSDNRSVLMKNHVQIVAPG